MERAESIWRPLGELLVSKGLVSEDELELALAEQQESGRLLGAILVERGYVSGPALAVALAEQYGVELATERGFGTGLWAEIDRRHRAGRGHDGAQQRPEPEQGDPHRDNVVKLEPAKLASAPDPGPDPELERLEEENRRLQEELDRLRGEFRRLELVQAPEPLPRQHLLFVPTPARYVVVEDEGPPPEPGTEIAIAEAGRFVVTKVGRAPYPREPRPCAFLLPLG